MNPLNICGDIIQNVSENVFENATLGSILGSIRSEKLKYLRNYKELKLDFLQHIALIYIYIV